MNLRNIDKQNHSTIWHISKSAKFVDQFTFESFMLSVDHHYHLDRLDIHTSVYLCMLIICSKKRVHNSHTDTHTQSSQCTPATTAYGYGVYFPPPHLIYSFFAPPNHQLIPSIYTRVCVCVCITQRSFSFTLNQIIYHKSRMLLIWCLSFSLTYTCDYLSHPLCVCVSYLGIYVCVCVCEHVC